MLFSGKNGLGINSFNFSSGDSYFLHYMVEGGKYAHKVIGVYSLSFSEYANLRGIKIFGRNSGWLKVDFSV